MKLKTLVKQEWLEENSKDEKAHLPNRDSFLSSISTYEGHGKSIYRENKLKEIAETSKKKKEIKYLKENPHEDPRIPEFDDSGMDELYDEFGNYIGD